MDDALCLSPVNILPESSVTHIPFERIALLYPSSLFLLSTSSNQHEYHIEVGVYNAHLDIKKIFISYSIFSQ